MVRLLTGLLALMSSCLVIAPVNAQETEYAIEEVRPDIYRYTAGSYRSLFWVTEDGIVVMDTLSTEAATRLKAELDARFDVPVRYVIYSHSHYDHSYGGEVFDEPGVTFISHDLARQSMEISGAQTVLADLTFDDEMSLTLGDETLHLQYHGQNNGAGSVSMLFEEAGLLYVVDWIVVGRMPWTNLEGYDIEGMILSTRDILAMDWDVFVGGHASIGDREGVEHYLGYIEALHAAVRDGMLVGKSLETLQAEIELPEYSDLLNYDAWLADNIGGVYRMLADQNYILKRPEVAAVMQSE